jgi:hypothetical protein
LSVLSVISVCHFYKITAFSQSLPILRVIHSEMFLHSLRLLFFIAVPTLVMGDGGNPFAVLEVNTCSYGSYNSTPAVVPTGDGDVIVAWTSYRQGNTFQNLYVQKLNDAGEPQWEPDGTPVAPMPAGQDVFEIVADGYGGVVIVWEDFRFGKENSKIYAQRINLRGEPLWGKEGMRMCSHPGPQRRPRITADHASGFYLVWEDERTAPGENDIYAQHIDLAGRASWIEDGVPIATSAGAQKNVKIIADTDHFLYLIWEDFRNGRYWNLYCQKIDLHRNFFWSEGGLDIFAGVEENHQNPALVPDGYGGILFVYQKWSEQSRGYDIFRGRLLSNGMLEYHFSTCFSIDDQVNPIIIRKGINAIVAWEDRRYGDWDIYTQMVRIKDGLLVWDPNGMPVSRIEGEDRQPQLVTSSAFNDQVVIWNHRDGEKMVMYLQKLDENGARVWDDAGVRLSGGPGPEVDGAVAYDNDGNIWCAWADSRESSGQYCYVQKINWNGVRLLKNDGNKLAAPNTTAYPAIENPQMIAATNGDFVIAWTDYRNGSQNADIYMQRFTEDGVPRWRNGGIPVCMAPGEQAMPVMVEDGVGGVILIWTDNRNGIDENLYAQRINLYGKVQWNQNGVLVCDAPRNQGQVRAVPDAREGVVLCWSDSRSLVTNSFDLYIQRVSYEGECLWGINGKPFANFPGLETAPSLAPDGDGGAYISWMDDRPGKSNIYVQHINHYGIYEWEFGGRVLASSGYNQRTPQLLVNFENDVYLAWEDARLGDGNEKIYMQCMSPNGTRIWGNSGQAVCPIPGRQTKTGIAASESGILWVAWLDERTEAFDGHRLFIQKFDLGGNPQWETGGIPAGRGLIENNDFSIGINHNGYAFLVWSRPVTTQRREVCFQKIHPDGQPKFEENGHCLGAGMTDQLNPDLAINSEGIAMVCWVQRNLETGAQSLMVVEIKE